MIYYKLTQHARSAIAERKIDVLWIERVLENPAAIERDRTDSELRHALGRISEQDGRVLRVICNVTTNPWLIVTAYFDRTMRNKL